MCNDISSPHTWYQIVLWCARDALIDHVTNFRRSRQISPSRHTPHMLTEARQSGLETMMLHMMPIQVALACIAHACMRVGVWARCQLHLKICADWRSRRRQPKDVHATSTWLISTRYRFGMCASGVLEARAQTGNMQSMIAEIAHVSTLLRWCHCVRFTSRDTKIGKSFLLLVASLNLLRPTKPSPNTKCATAYGRSVTIPARRQGSTVRPFPPHWGHLRTFYN